MAVLSGDAGHAKRLRARLDDDPSGRLLCQPWSQVPRWTAPLLQNVPGVVADAHLTLLTTQVNADVVHGRPPLVSVSGPSIEGRHFIHSVLTHLRGSSSISLLAGAVRTIRRHAQVFARPRVVAV